MASQANRSNISRLREYPVTDKPKDEVARPFRLWDAKEKAQMRWRCYANLRHAHVGVLCEAAWSDGSTTIEIFDITTGSLRGQYTRVGDQIKFWRSHHKLEAN